MADADDIEAKYAHASELVAQKIGPRGPDLKRQVRKAGRRLPRSVRNDLQVLAHATDLVRHPKLARQVNAETVSIAYNRAKAHLDTIDPKDRRKGIFLTWLGDNAFNLLLVFVFLVVVLRLRGLV